MKTKFLHLRPVQKYVTKNGTIAAPATRGGITIAYEVEKDEDGWKVHAVAACRCHPNDNYNKEVARAKAAGRLKSKRYRTNAGGVLERTFIEQSVKDFNAGALNHSN